MVVYINRTTTKEEENEYQLWKKIKGLFSSQS